jgi:hypothetical protein
MVAEVGMSSCTVKNKIFTESVHFNFSRTKDYTFKSEINVKSDGIHH